MQYSSGLPAWFVAAFANAGDKNTIPATTVVTGAAALNTGWPSICSLPEEAGGIAPTREDLNGILYWLSHSIQRLQAGGFMPYDATFATAIGGYPKGALVRKADGTGYWISTADSNTTDPDGGSAANWVDAGIAAGAQSYMPPGIWLFWGGQSCPSWALENGSIVSVSAYPELVAATYVGDSENATARGFYKTTSNTNPSANRSTTGQYFVIPDEAHRVLAAADGAEFWPLDQYGAVEIYQSYEQMPSHCHTQRLTGGVTSSNYGTQTQGSESPGLGRWSNDSTSYAGEGDPMSVEQETSTYNLVITY